MNNFDKKFESDLSRVQMNKIEKCSEQFMIGKLRFNNPTRVDANNSIQFYIEALCDDPKPIIEIDAFNSLDDNYIGFDYKQYDSVMPQFYDPRSYDAEERQEELENHLNNKLIIFTPDYTSTVEKPVGQ